MDCYLYVVGVPLSSYGPYFDKRRPRSANDVDRRPKKIGIATNPFKRLSGLQIGNPDRIEILRLWVFPSVHQARHEEMALHKLFSKSLIHGEWFLLSLKEIDQGVGRDRTDPSASVMGYFGYDPIRQILDFSTISDSKPRKMGDAKHVIDEQASRVAMDIISDALIISTPL